MTEDRSWTKIEFVKLIRTLIQASSRTQIEIARELGYENPNIITMFKQGKTRVPPEKVASLAYILGTCPRELLQRWFLAYEPDLLRDINAHLLASAEH